ncbi:hypothetical protein [Pseudomonas sp. P9(2020)]|uniref:hypothetical protein n=1 Tax=Pseudomonas sp. P9(2020) TaxID=2763316 RepID=UPI001B341E79|nr:hypothetical protein [Pseudomonas sp. P9(2020)]MBP5948036.1 hypothetical protein [Pseudomonas sp. P9(2020)]
MDNGALGSNTELNAKKSKRFGGWFYAILLGLIWWYVISPASDTFVMDGEATAGDYALVVREFPSLSPQLKREVAGFYDKGFLTRRDVTLIVGRIVDERPKGVTVSSSPNYGDTEEPIHAWMWRRVTGERADFKAKALLDEMIKTR